MQNRCALLLVSAFLFASTHVVAIPLTWLTTSFEWKVCTGKPFDSGNIANLVLLGDPGYTLPFPLVSYRLIGAPDFIVTEYRVLPGYLTADFYLTGTSDTTQVYNFEIEATFRGEKATVPARLKVIECPSFTE